MKLILKNGEIIGFLPIEKSYQEQNEIIGVIIEKGDFLQGDNKIEYIEPGKYYINNEKVILKLKNKQIISISKDYIFYIRNQKSEFIKYFYIQILAYLFPRSNFEIKYQNKIISILKDQKEVIQITFSEKLNRNYAYIYIMSNGKKKKIHKINKDYFEKNHKKVLNLIENLFLKSKENFPYRKNKFDLHIFLKNLKNDLDIDEIQSIRIFNKSNIKRFSIEYQGKEDIWNTIKYIKEYLEIPTIEFPEEIFF